MTDDLEAQIRSWVEDIDEPIPVRDIARSPGDRPRRRADRRRTLVAAAALSAVALAGGAWAALGGDSPTTVDTADDGAPITSTTAATAPPSTTTSTTTPATVPNLVVDVTDCESTVAYGSPEAVDPGRDGSPPRLMFHRPEDDLVGGVGFLTLWGDSTTAELGGAGVVREVREHPDGTAIVEWHQEEQPIGHLATKRFTPAEVTELADAIVTGTIPERGFEQVDAEQEAPTIKGFSCRRPGGLLAVEVVAGSDDVQLAWIADTDPTGTARHDGYTVLTFNREDGGEVPLRAVDDDAWRQLVGAAPAADSPPPPGGTGAPEDSTG